MSVETAPSPNTIEQDFRTLKLDEKLEPVHSSTANGTINISSSSSDKPVVVEARALPFTKPSSSSTIPTPPKLSNEEQSKYDQVLEHLKGIKELPVSSNKKNNKEMKELSDVEKYFLSRECILRYLRATKWNVIEAKKRLEVTIVWRREYGTDTLTAETIEPEVTPPIAIVEKWSLMFVGIDW